MLEQETSMVSNEKQSNIFTETFNKLFKENKESSMFDRFSSLDAKEKMLAVSTVGVIFGTLLPFVLVALPVAATGAAVALTLFFAVKAVEYAFKGLKWSAEMTWKGAKDVGGKIKDGAVYVKDSVKEAASSAKQATRERTDSALRTMGDRVQKFGIGMSNSGASMSSLDNIPYSIEPYGQTVVLKTEEKTKNFNSVKEMFIKEIFEDKAVNSSALTKEIFSELKRKILEKAYSVDGQQSFKKEQLINQLGQQADFVSKLNAKKLQKLLTQDDNNLYEIFSEHHSEIKEVIRDRKTYNLLRSSSTNSLNSNSTDGSTAGLLNPEEHKKAPTSLWNRFSSPFKSSKKSEQPSGAEYQPLSEPDAMPSAEIGNSIFYVAPQKPPRSNSPSPVTDSTVIPNDRSSRNKVIIGEYLEEEEKKQLASSTATVDPARLRRNSSSSSLYDGPPVLKEVTPPKAPESPTSDYVSERSSPNSSGPSTPTGVTPESLTQALAGLKKTGSPYKSGQPPSTKVDVDADVQHQTVPKSVA
ncbi:MAG: hypothetical protein LBJ80_02495 [Rickettsiales bacterium]|jgi:hypothetical protein|nr:hypothetical protein [Rickettsiales bacterium]MDR1261270.1 hypothetical protein [Rickettsiales bacterium]